VLCASFVVQSILARLFCVNASVSQASVCKSLLRPMVFCARDLSLTVRAFWRAEQLRWAEANFEEMRKVDQCSDEMKTVEKNLLRWHVRRDGMRWKEVRRAQMRWDEMRWDQMRWDEMKCGVWSASVKCEESVHLALHCTGSSAGHVLGQQQRNRFAQSTHARAWLAHGAGKFYRWERLCTKPRRQLPPRLVRVYWLNSIRQWSKHRLINLYRSIFSGWNAFLSSRSNWKLQGKYSINKKRIRRPAGVSRPCGSCLFV